MIGSWLLGRCACLHYCKFIRCSFRYQDLVYESCIFVRWCKIVVWSVCFGAICYEVFGQSTVMFLMKSVFSKDLFTMAEWYPSPRVNMCCTRTCLVYMFTIVRDIEWYSEIHIIIQKPNLLKPRFTNCQRCTPFCNLSQSMGSSPYVISDCLLKSQVVDFRKVIGWFLHYLKDTKAIG